MIRKFQLVILVLASSYFAVAQSYNNPESIVYDSVGQRYLISNKSGNTIVQLSLDNTLTNFVTSGLNGPKGLIIIGDTLISVNNTSVQGYLLSDASEVMRVNIPGTEFLNDVTTDGKGNIYVSEMNKSCIYRISLATKAYDIFNSKVINPNGLLYDSQRNAVMVCSMGSNAKIQSLSLSDSSLTDLVTTRLTDLDGLARDNCGNIYVTSWGTGAVYAFDPDFKNPPTQIIKGINGPADISISPNDQKLLIPRFNENKISMLDLGMDCPAEVNYVAPADYSVQKNDTVTVKWESVDGATSYNVEYGTDSLFYITKEFKATEQTNTDLEPLKEETTYYWRVAAVVPGKKTIYCNPWHFTTSTWTSLIDKNLSSELILYPNPCRDIIHFQMPVNSASVINVSGQVLIHLNKPVEQMDISDLKRGLYFVEFEDQTGLVEQKKIIKE